MAPKAASTSNKGASVEHSGGLGQRNLKIREARQRLPEMVREVGSSSARYTVGQRGDATATVVSTQRVEPLFDRRKEPKLALVIVEQLLPDAPLHLKTPAVEELSKLSSEDLLLLLTIDSLPLSKRRISALRKGLENPEVLDRLIRRFELANALAGAAEEGLYEVAEHKTSQAL